MTTKQNLSSFIAKKRYKHLYALLNINYDEKLDGEAIIQAIHKNPQSASKKFKFDSFPAPDVCYPLHRAIERGANIDVIKAIYNVYPSALKEKNNGLTTLHLALRWDALAEVVSFILNKFPEATQERDKVGNVPLYLACTHDAQFEVVSLLLKVWPDAAMAKNLAGFTPLHCASHHAPVEIVSLLLDHCPQNIRATDNVIGTVPLHYACSGYSSLEVILLLLEKWPNATRKRTKHGEKTPLTLFQENRKKYVGYPGLRRKRIDNPEEDGVIEKALSYVYKLCGDSIGDDGIPKEMIDFFIDIGWKCGIFLVIDKFPSLKEQIDIGISIFPTFLSKVARRCKMKTMWHIISNELDIVEGI